MLISPPMKRAEAKAKEIDEKLRADDPRFRGAVRLTHEDGSIFFWDSAFCEYVWMEQTLYLMVFTEHHRYHVFAEDELDGVRAWPEGGYVSMPKCPEEEETP